MEPIFGVVMESFLVVMMDDGKEDVGFRNSGGFSSHAARK